MLKSYKTTIVGWLAAFVYAYSQNALTCLQNGNIDEHCLKVMAVSALIGVLGTLAKDNDVTGGKREQ